MFAYRKATLNPMPMDKSLYDQLSATWWDENESLGILRTWFNPVRFGYFRRVLLDVHQIAPQGVSLLDVGCGGGLLAEEFARLGCQVTGIDPSELSLQTAREHAHQQGLSITYQTGRGEQLPFADASFELVTCCDVLEHVDDVQQVIREIARVLKPGGLFFYDTINRSFIAWLGDIKLAQDWPATSFMPANLHEWQKFIKPRELQRYLAQAHLHSQEMRGISPRTHPLATIACMLQHKRGKLTMSEFGQRLGFHESYDRSGSYMGYAAKNA
jgi:2-polyprenyl-6-hydroxyphenyl methylase/3-demethylubiquinone-9 3-methyltransferase